MLDSPSNFNMRDIPFHRLIEVLDHLKKSGKESEATRLEQAIFSARKSYEKGRLDNILTRINEAMTKSDVECNHLLEEICRDFSK
jgi:hypothetical protein